MGKEMKGNLNMLERHSADTYKGFGTKFVAVSLIALALAGCSDRGTKSNGYLLGSLPRANHPIVVSKKVIAHRIAVSRSSYTLGQAQYNGLKQFVRSYRDQGRGILKVKAPTGTPNETAAFNVMATVREVISTAGIPDEAVIFTPYSGGSDPEAPIKLEYTGYTATPSACGRWDENLAESRKNMPYADLGCAYQNNMARMIANPQDLIEARGMGDRNAARRDVTYGKYIKGDATASEKSADQDATLVKGN